MSPIVDVGAIRAMLVSTRPVASSSAEREAGVAMIFDSALDLLVIRRAECAGDPWSGHLAFPGGRRESADSDTLATAVRETGEEVGLNLSEAEVLGALEEVRTVSGLPDLGVRPWVFYVSSFDGATTSGEAPELLRVPLSTLLSGVGRSSFAYPWQGRSVTLPCVEIGQHRLWGMTLRMVDDLLHRLDGGGVGLGR